MAQDKTSIANGALAFLGAARINSLAEGSTAAAALNDVWSSTRRHLLRINVWNFAKTRVQLPADADRSVSFGYARSFTLPPNHVRLVRLGSAITEPAYSLEDGRILTDAKPPLEVVYIRDVEDVARWDAAFASVFTAGLAVAVAMRITSSAAMVKAAQTWQAEMMEDARQVDAIENQDEAYSTEGTLTWLEARSLG